MRRIHTIRIGVALFVCLVCIAVIPALAHHSTAMFDTSRVGTIRGVVTKVVWTMPHPYFKLDVADERGAKWDWYVEGSSVRLLERIGWSNSTVRPGDGVTVCGNLGRVNVSTQPVFPDGAVLSRAMYGVTVKLADGRSFSFQSESRSCIP